MLRIAVAQFNATVGDLTGNVEGILKCAAEARARAEDERAMGAADVDARYRIDGT